MFLGILLHDTDLARSFCLISWLKRAGVAGSSAPPFFCCRLRLHF